MCMYNTCNIQYNEKFALKNWQTHCQFNLAHKLKRTEMFKRRMKWEILRIEIVLNVKLTKIRKMNEVKTTKIRKNWKGKKWRIISLRLCLLLFTCVLFSFDVLRGICLCSVDTCTKRTLSLVESRIPQTLQLAIQIKPCQMFKKCYN